MAPIPQNPDAYVKSIRAPPPPGAPYSLPIPGSERDGRSAVYRHWRFVDGPLLQTLDPSLLTAHDAFESTSKKRSSARALGTRHWNAATQTHGKFEWITYGEVAARRRNLGVGLVELHKNVGITGDQYGIGLWCQNRAEWQLTGKFLRLGGNDPLN